MSIEKIKKRLNESPKSTFLEEAKYRQEHETWLDISFMIALKILSWLKKNKMTQAELAQKLAYSPQYVNKIVKGSENLTLETICKIEKVLGIKLIEVFAIEKTVQYQTEELFINSKTSNFLAKTSQILETEKFYELKIVA